MTKTRKPSGSRQRIWSVLRGLKGPVKVADIAELARVDMETCKRYMYALKVAGYVANEGHQWMFINDTGPLAVQINGRGVFNDFNLNPPMTGDELGAIIKASGLSLNAFAIEIGLGAGMSTRLRQMINGQKLVGRSIEEKARAYMEGINAN